MKYKIIIFIVITMASFLLANQLKAQEVTKPQSADSLTIPNNEKLVIVWTSGDRDVAIKMVFMYTFNAK